MKLTCDQYPSGSAVNAMVVNAMGISHLAASAAARKQGRVVRWGPVRGMCMTSVIAGPSNRRSNCFKSYEAVQASPRRGLAVGEWNEEHAHGIGTTQS